MTSVKKKQKRITHINPVRKGSLTARQEKFVGSYLKHRNASQAYRDAYSTTNMSKNTIGRNAFEVLHNDKVAAKIKEMEDKATQNMVYGLQEHIRELDEAKAYALTRRSVAGVVRCTELKGKAHGLYKDHVELTGKEGGPIDLRAIPTYDLSKLTDEEVEQLYRILGKLQEP